MKKLPKLLSLPMDDQKRLLDLCEKHTYDHVVDLVAMPREQGGLDLRTNRSALSRFYRDHGSITSNSHLTAQFLDILECQGLDLDDIVPSMAQLLGQSAFQLLVRNRPFDECRRPLEAFLRFERLAREREKNYEQRERERQARSVLHAAVAPSASPANPAPKPVPPNQAKPAQPATHPAIQFHPQAYPAPIKPDFKLASFKTPASKNQPNGTPSTPAASMLAPEQFQLLKTTIPFSDFLTTNPA